MKKINSIIIVGSSGSGKTTLVNGLRTKKYADKVVVPRRYITRPQRQGDDLIENIHITKEEFEQKLKAGEIDPAWTRELENGRLEQYGFVPIEPGDNRLRIYSGNNAFLRDINSSVQKILNNAQVVVCMAQPEKRTSRLGDRSPDMSESERSVRLSDSGADALEFDNIEIIETTNLSPADGQKALQDLMQQYA
ncbi:MAG: hypothetical protein AAB395_01255 [Patescibacteria group bacterium]|mgnify:CR=1 FL=1